jgi:hypothetical protein
MPAVVVQISAGGLTEIYAGYDPAFIAELKATIPSSFRSWYKPTKCWSVRHPYGDIAVEIVRRHHRRVKVDDQRRRPSPRSARLPDNSDVFVALRLVLGETRWPAAYRALSKLLHPDAGGDGELMRRLNAAADGRHRSSRRRSA